MKSITEDLPHPLPNWHCDFYSGTLGVTLDVSEILFHEQSTYQDVKICQTSDFGKALLLNNFIYRTEKSNFAVPEMLAHVPMRIGFEKKNVLIIGGGDGYTAKELTKYDNLIKIDVVDIDQTVVDACKQHFPIAAEAFSDNRVKVHISEGYEFVRKATTGSYDLILVTGTEGENLDGSPGISYSLFQEGFYQECSRILSDRGVLLVDASMVYFDISSFNYVYLNSVLEKYFKTTKSNLLVSGTLLSGLFAMTIASKYYDPENDILQDYSSIKTQYYNTKVHKASFALPQLMLDKMSSKK